MSNAELDALLENAKPYHAKAGSSSWYGWGTTSPENAGGSCVPDCVNPGGTYPTESAAMDALRAAVAKIKEAK